jgi:hypothetical protein
MPVAEPEEPERRAVARARRPPKPIVPWDINHWLALAGKKAKPADEDQADGGEERAKKPAPAAGGAAKRRGGFSGFQRAASGGVGLGWAERLAASNDRRAKPDVDKD